MSNQARREFRKAQKRFSRFIENENNQLAVFNALRDVASSTLPGVDVTNPNALLNVANNPQQNDEFERRWAIVFLIIFILFFLLVPSSAQANEEESS
ncbi:hypothetical protein [Peribacillus asahii]|uniref:hypothetical protein n=1 Tax=Peribacillus asahii TaxID=228899 RepID=UPI00207A8EA4|nr:hypothetical protein [Peribacillus asahii]USK62554.1 hypothetical protein LIT37_24650 [Peribacillus asahii]